MLLLDSVICTEGVLVPPDTAVTKKKMSLKRFEYHLYINLINGHLLACELICFCINFFICVLLRLLISLSFISSLIYSYIISI
jgi:hypothetical protein